jgi:hypothetical protein
VDVAGNALEHGSTRDAGVRVGGKFLRAARWSAERHAEHQIEVPAIPSVAQVLGLATLVLEDGGSEREAIAAMVLDALGDDVPTRELRDRFGKKVTALVLACHPDRGTISPGRVPVDTDRWRVRAEAALERAIAERDPGALRIRAASVLQEARALQRELRRNGTIAYVRCPAPPAEHLGHLRELVTVLTRRRPRTPITEELRGVAGDIERLSEMETATIAWRVTRAGAA